MAASPFSLLRDPGYARAWAIGLFGNTMRWLEMLAVGIFVFETTGSALLVAAMTIARQLPLALFGTFVGPLAERMDRGRLLAAGYAAAAAVSATVCALAAADALLVWHLAVCAFLGGTCWTLDFPARRTLLGEFAGPERLGPGVSLDAATNNATRMAGPLCGGAIYGLAGLDGAFAVTAALHAVCAAIALTFAARRAAARPAAEPYFAMLRRGVAMVRRSRELVGVYAVTVILNVFGFPYAAMVPVLGRARYEVGPAAIGALSAAEGAGAFLGAMAVAFLARPAAFRRLFLYGAMAFMFGVFCLSLAPWYGLGVAILFASGLGMAGFGAMQSTLVLTLAPAEARSRLMGLLSVCIGCAPLGLLNLGLLADRFGAPTALSIVSAAGLALLAATAALVPELRR